MSNDVELWAQISQQESRLYVKAGGSRTIRKNPIVFTSEKLHNPSPINHAHQLPLGPRRPPNSRHGFLLAQNHLESVPIASIAVAWAVVRTVYKFPPSVWIRAGHRVEDC